MVAGGPTALRAGQVGVGEMFIVKEAKVPLGAFSWRGSVLLAHLAHTLEAEPW